MRINCEFWSDRIEVDALNIDARAATVNVENEILLSAEDSDFEWNKDNKEAEEDSNVTFEEELERKISLLVKDKKV